MKKCLILSVLIIIYKEFLKLYFFGLFNLGLPDRSSFATEECSNERRRLRSQWQSMNVYERHKLLINQYVLYHPGATSLLKRDT